MRYQVELSNGVIINVPSDKARTQYEYISAYGHQAILERSRRARSYIEAQRLCPDISIRAIIAPNGDRWTQI